MDLAVEVLNPGTTKQQKASSVNVSVLLVYGYLRMLENEKSVSISTSMSKSTKIPSPIKDLIYEFYPKQFHYKGRFTAENCGSTITWVSPTKIRMTAYIRSAKLDIGISVQDLSSYFWILRFHSDSECNEYHFMGVISNRSDTDRLDRAAYSGERGPRDCYGLSGNPPNVFKGLNKVQNDESYTVSFVNQAIRVQLNGSTQRLSYFWGKEKNPNSEPNPKKPAAVNATAIAKEDAMATSKEFTFEDSCFYSMQLPTDILEIHAWYPAISLANTGNSCELIEWEED